MSELLLIGCISCEQSYQFDLHEARKFNSKNKFICDNCISKMRYDIKIINEAENKRADHYNKKIIPCDYKLAWGYGSHGTTMYYKCKNCGAMDTTKIQTVSCSDPHSKKYEKPLHKFQYRITSNGAEFICKTCGINKHGQKNEYEECKLK